MPRTIVIDSYQEFADRHGGSPVQVENIFLFPDGASVNGDDRDDRREPPADPTERLRARRDYVAAHLDRTIDNFQSLKAHCHEQASLAARYTNLPGPPVDAPKELRRLAALAEKYREELAEIDAQLAETPEAQRQRELDALRAEQNARQAQLMAEIKGIEI